MSLSTIGILDINTSSVDGAVIEVTKDAGQTCPKILVSSSTAIDVPENLDLSRFLDLTLASLQNTMSALTGPTRWFVFLGAPFYVAQSKTIKSEKPTPFAVTPKMIARLTGDEVTKFKQAEADLIPGMKGDPRELINSSVMKIKLNGYDNLKHIYQKEVLSLELSLYLASSSSELLKRFKETISAVMRIKQISFFPFSFALFSTFRDLTPTRNDSSLIIDIDGETTEIGLVENDVLTENISFPVGINSLVRQVAADLGTVKEEAYSSLKMLAAGKRQQFAEEKLSAVTDKFLADWTGKFYRAIDSSLEHFLPTNKVLITGNRFLVPLFTAHLKKPAIENLVIGDKNFEVNFFQDKIVASLCEISAAEMPTVRIMTEAIFSDKIIKLS